MHDFLTDKDWSTLLLNIKGGRVLPVIGPELITVVDPSSGEVLPFQRYLAPMLAARLRIVDGKPDLSINDLTCQHLLSGGSRNDIYEEIRLLMDELKPDPSPALLALARIKGFNLFISSSFDHYLASALASVRPEFDIKQHLLAYHPTQHVDIEEPQRSTVVVHLLGDYNTIPDFAVWEEDYMEFICGLLKHQATDGSMPNLFRQMKSRHLLLLGAPFSDWIVRFFLRTARGSRLTDRSKNEAADYLTDRSENLEAPLVFYFDKLVQATRVITGDPAAFVMELSRRWQEKFGDAASDEDFLTRIPERLPKDSVFISYAREDKGAAFKLARALHAANVPVWLDKARLQIGHDFDAHLKNAVSDCSFFISLISAITEADSERKRYFHTERDWIAERQSPGFLYYLPVAIDATLPEKWQPQHEPECFAKSHYLHLPNGEPSREFITQLRSAIETFRSSGRPRG